MSGRWAHNSVNERDYYLSRSTLVFRTASPTSGPSFALPDAVRTARSTGELLVLVGDEHRDPARPNSIAVEIRTFQCAAKGAGAKASPHQMAAGAGGRGSRGRKSGRAQTARILRLDVAIRSMEAEAIFRELRNEIWLRSIKRTP